MIASKKTFNLVSLAIQQDPIEDSLRNANAWDFVESMPEKTKQRIGEKGNRVSGGQLQEACIGKGFYQKLTHPFTR